MSSLDLKKLPPVPLASAMAEATGAPAPEAAPSLGGFLYRTFSSLTIRNYRLFFVGQGISLLGTWIRRTALGWLVYEITGSKVLLGSVMGLALLPMFIFSPLAGGIADRVDKRRLIIASQVLSFATSLAIALLIWTGLVEIWHLMVLAVLGGVAFAFEVPARQAFVYDMVGREHLTNAVALNSALVNATRVIGPALAGILMATVGAASCFAFDALSYLVVILTLLSLRLPAVEIPKILESHWEHVRLGAVEAWRNPLLRSVLTLLVVVGIFGFSFQTLMPAIVMDVMKLGEKEYGVLMSLQGIGALFGALFVARSASLPNKGWQLFAGPWIMVVGLVLFSLTRTMATMAPTLLVIGFGGVLFISTGNTSIQTNVAHSMRGRIMGLWALAFGGSLPLGNFLVGAVGEALDPFATVQLCAATLLAVTVAMYRFFPAAPPTASPPAPGAEVASMGE